MAGEGVVSSCPEPSPLGCGHRSLISGTSTQLSLLVFPSPSLWQEPQMISGSFVSNLALVSASLKFLLRITLYSLF